jgi:hypothetical protein
MRRFARLLAASCIACSAATVVAADGAAAGKDVEPLMTVRGKQLLADDFGGPSLDAKWKAAKGKWEVKDGALKGVEVASDMHAAAVRTQLALADAIYQFDLRFDGGKTAHLSVNGAKGHLFRVTITPAGFQVRKDGSKTDEADKPLLLDSCQMKFEPGKWYTMVVEVCRDEVVARVGDRCVALGADAKLASPKTNFGFPVSGDSVSIDNVKVWEATPSPTWAAAKEKLMAEQQPKVEAGSRRPAGKAKAPATKPAA